MLLGIAICAASAPKLAAAFTRRIGNRRTAGASEETFEASLKMRCQNQIVLDIISPKLEPLFGFTFEVPVIVPTKTDSTSIKPCRDPSPPRGDTK